MESSGVFTSACLVPFANNVSFLDGLPFVLMFISRKLIVYSAARCETGPNPAQSETGTLHASGATQTPSTGFKGCLTQMWVFMLFVPPPVSESGCGLTSNIPHNRCWVHVLAGSHVVY